MSLGVAAVLASALTVPKAWGPKNLESEERIGGRTWILYTFPPVLASSLPDLWEKISSEYETAAEFSSTLNGGVVIVAVKE